MWVRQNPAWKDIIHLTIKGCSLSSNGLKKQLSQWMLCCLPVAHRSIHKPMVPWFPKIGHEGVSSRLKFSMQKNSQNVSSKKVLKSFVLRFAGLYGPKRHLLLQKVKEGKIINGSRQRILNLLHRMMRLALSSVVSNPASINLKQS